MIGLYLNDAAILGEEGETLLAAVQRAGAPCEGTCNGQLACATCHLVIDPAWAERLPRASEEEEDMLDLVPGAVRTSRLSCQLRLTQALDGLRVNLP
jgi:ferredoxin-2, mitochondrial